ncbi:MAG: hypothetical protein Ct9H90mP19_2850 [Gammaproteobacteria bacterium]|nr:MAG: hypothetical protein Ct9H90mP19_2850 [Gammaproteobacteria bacterium]
MHLLQLTESLPQHLEQSKSPEIVCAGMLFSEEVTNIEYALKESASLNSIVGGSKISTKLKVIESPF